MLVLIVRSPLWPVIDALFIDNEPAVLTDRFDRVRSNSTVALGTLIGARLRVDVFIEASFVDVSRCHRFHQIQEFASMANPSPIEGTIEISAVQHTRHRPKPEITALPPPSCVLQIHETRMERDLSGSHPRASLLPLNRSIQLVSF